MKFDLKDKKILITGSSGGIGKAICKKFIETDSKIIFTSSNQENLDKLSKEYGNQYQYHLLDLLDSDNISKQMKEITESNPDISVLINNAGITKDNIFLRMKEDQWHDVIKINLNSNYYIIKSILPFMIKNKQGKIIGITSIVGSTGNPGQANYAASKAGMISMYKSIAIEVAQRNININLISPGFIETPMTNKLDENQKNNILTKIPMKRFGLPEDVANLAIFLASSNSSYITGQTIHVNGGMLML